MSNDFSSLSVKELSLVIAEAKTAIEGKREREKDEVRAEILAIAEDRGYSIEELFVFGGKTNKKNKVAPTHLDPSEPTNTWAGRGRKPKWLTKAIEEGQDINDFVIKV
jgi:DNA-binding protein H-NS